MKKYILIFALLIGVTSFYNTTEAQNVNISINIGRQPAWGPVGYDYVDYYYMPDINCYFNVNLGLFYYPDRGRWVSARYLPYGYRNYDLYGMYKVVLVNVHDPWRYNNIHYRDYSRYRDYRNQIVIRDSRDTRYGNSRNNRIAWYSGHRDNNYRQKEYRYDGRDNNRNNNKNYSNGKKDNNNRQNFDNGNRQSGRNNKKDSNATRSAKSSERGNYRLASNSERTNRK
jgi:hypothetical protein